MEGFHGNQLLVEELDEDRVKRVVSHHSLVEVLTGSAIWQRHSAPAVHVHIRVRCLTRGALIDMDKQTLGKHPEDLGGLDRNTVTASRATTLRTPVSARWAMPSAVSSVISSPWTSVMSSVSRCVCRANASA